MNFRIILFIVLGFFIFNSLSYSHAIKVVPDGDIDEMPDTTRRSNTDSIKEARTRIADSLKEARKRITDSIKAAREHKADSLQETRERRTDSLNAIKKYKESRHYRDSVARARNPKTKAIQKKSSTGAVSHADSLKEARQHVMDSVNAVRKARTDSLNSIRKYKESKYYKDSVNRAHKSKEMAMKDSRQAHMDSVKLVRQRSMDSITNSRKAKTDSIKAIQKHRTDSLTARKKYKESKRYSDSVTVRKHEHSDSIKSAQKAIHDKMTALRKHTMDSAKASRQHVMDSTKMVRTKRMDSLKMVRKVKTDSLAKIKSDKAKLAKAKEKKKLEDQKLKLELKIKAKHEAWSNKSMLKKRWSPMRRVAQNSFTHYNYYYNAKRKMEEAEMNMQRSRKENFDSLIGLYPFDPNKDSSLMSPDMDSIIRKVSIGIQIHDPRVKWSNDMYLLLGQAYYYKGSYEYAAIAFRYIINSDEEEKKKEVAKTQGASKSKDEPTIIEDNKRSMLDFLKHRSVHNEAILWLARTYTEAHQPENAETILSLLESGTKLPEDLKGRLAIEKAFVHLNNNNLPAASEQLDIAADDEYLPNWLRLRASFLNGQILQNMGNYAEAANSFERVIRYYPKIEMDFYSRKYMAFNQLMAGESSEVAMRGLKSTLHDGKYTSYYDQVYYVLGQLAVKAKQPGDAVTYFTKSVTTPKATKKQKALTYTALGDVYYSMSSYIDAKRSYDSAAKYGTSTSKDKNMIAASQRSKGLEEISGPTRIIYEQDSLLLLAGLSRKEQAAAARKYLRYLEQKKEDSAKNAANGPEVSIPITPDNEEAPTEGGNSWYFSNPTLVQQGSEDFKRKWGNRPLVDNWQRSASISNFSGGSGSIAGNDNNDEDSGADNTDQDNGLPTEASLLARIPNTQTQKEAAWKQQQKAYIALAKAYFVQLDDQKMSIKTLDTLDVRFPNHNQKEEELYLRYQIALKQKQLDKAQAYSQELVAKFPNSKYASLMKPRGSESRDNAEAQKSLATYFDETYDILQKRQYTEALMRVENGKKQYEDNPLYTKRFQLIEATAQAGLGDFDRADTILTKFIAANPSDTLTAWATAVKSYIKQVRNGGKPSWYYDTVVKKTPTLATTKKETPSVTPKPVTPPTPPAPKVPEMYSYHADSPHYCIIVTPGVDSRSAGLKDAVKKYDAKNDSTAGLNILFDLYDIDHGVFVIRSFRNAATAKTYMTGLQTIDVFNNFKPGEVQVYIITSENYKKMFYDKNPVPYSSFFSAYYR